MSFKITPPENIKCIDGYVIVSYTVQEGKASGIEIKESTHPVILNEYALKMVREFHFDKPNGTVESLKLEFKTELKECENPGRVR